MSHDDDPRNADLRIWIDGKLLPRSEAKVSVFDSGFVLGDGVWEGLRLVGGRFAFLDAHLDRLYEAAKALFIDVGLTRDELEAALAATVAANGMRDDAHVRLMVTRGLRRSPYQDPRLAVGKATVVIVAEHKKPDVARMESGLKLSTAWVRRGAPDVQDPKLNSHSKLNCILACIQAAQAGCDEALMLDPHGFVATCNSTNFFIVRKGEVWTSSGRYCMPGITRANVIRICRDHGLPVFEKDFSLLEVYGADEAFCTGTLSGLVHVTEVDGRVLNDAQRGPLVEKLQGLYRELVARDTAR